MAKAAPSPATETKRDLLQRRFDEIEHQFREAVDKASHLEAQVRVERKAIEELNVQYEAACRKFASGEDAKIAPIVAERDRRSDRLRGLETLHREASEALKPIRDEHEAALRALQEEDNRLELKRLADAVSDANAKRNAAQVALSDAQKAANEAIWAHSRFLRHLELKAQGRA